MFSLFDIMDSTSLKKLLHIYSNESPEIECVLLRVRSTQLEVLVLHLAIDIGNSSLREVVMLSNPSFR
jgi:hypothetical protein